MSDNPEHNVVRKQVRKRYAEVADKEDGRCASSNSRC